MAILGVDDFKSKLVGGGARSNMFKVTCNFPSYAQGDVELTSFLCKAAQLPASILNPVEVNFRGRKLQMAGDRTFEPWTVTVINTEEFGQVDISGSYDINDTLTVFFEGINITEEELVQTGRFPNQVYNIEDNGARYAVGIRGKW